MSDPTVQWPASATKEDGNDLSEPIVDLLTNLHNIGKPPPDTKDPSSVTTTKTPYSLQVITSGATAFSKWWAGVVAAAGGLGALLTSLGGVTGKIGGGASDTAEFRSSLVLSGGILAASVAIAVAIIVRSDVSARASTTAARMAERAQIVTAFLDNYQYSRPVPPPVTPAEAAVPAAQAESRYVIKRNDDPTATAHSVRRFVLSGGQLRAQLTNASEVTGADISEIDEVVD